MTDAEESLKADRRLERNLVLVRWVGVALGAYILTQGSAGAPPQRSARETTLGAVLVGLLGLGNLVVLAVLRRAPAARALRRLGLSALTLDCLVILGLASAFGDSPDDSTWIIAYVLPLEGAIRYRLKGALAVAGLGLAGELGRELYLAARFPVEGQLAISMALFRGGSA